MLLRALTKVRKFTLADVEEYFLLQSFRPFLADLSK